MPLRKKRYRREPVAEINMTNLIDIVMVLLIVFILVSNFVQTGLEISIPKVQYAEHTGKEKIIIGVKTGELTLNGEKIAKEELVPKLEELKASFPEEQVFIRADEKTAVGDFMEVMSDAKLAGFENVMVPLELLPQPKM